MKLNNKYIIQLKKDNDNYIESYHIPATRCRLDTENRYLFGGSQETLHCGGQDRFDNGHQSRPVKCVTVGNTAKLTSPNIKCGRIKAAYL